MEVDEHGSVAPNPFLPNAAVIEQAVGPSPLTRMSQDILDLQSSVRFLPKMVNHVQTLSTRLPGICNETVRHDTHAATACDIAAIACDIAAVDSRQPFPSSSPCFPRVGATTTHCPPPAFAQRCATAPGGRLILSVAGVRCPVAGCPVRWPGGRVSSSGWPVSGVGVRVRWPVAGPVSGGRPRGPRR